MTLMSPDQTTGLVFDKNNQESIQEAVNDAIVDLYVGDYDWRLPTKDELEYLYTNSDVIQSNLSSLSFVPLTLSIGVGSSATYFIKKANGDYVGCNIKTRNEITPNDGTIVRVFTTLTFNQ